MFLKAAFKNASVFVQLVILVVVIICGMLFAILLSSLLIATKVGISPEQLKGFQLLDFPDLIRGTEFLSQLGLFVIPAIICAWLFSDNYKEYLRIDHPFHLPVAFWTITSMIVALPFLNLITYLNQQMVFPEALKGLETWMRESEDAASQVTDLMLNTKDIPTIVFNVLIICVVAAVSEEFMFRGLLQTLFGRAFKNPHVLIWIIAILFSAIHLQFYGFITRLLLGVWLGYLMYYTKTIWIPVVAHFTNNFFTVFLYYLFQGSKDKIDNIDSIGIGSLWWVSIVSLALFSFCFMQIKKAVVQ